MDFIGFLEKKVIDTFGIFIPMIRLIGKRGYPASCDFFRPKLIWAAGSSPPDNEMGAGGKISRGAAPKPVDAEAADSVSQPLGCAVRTGFIGAAAG